MDAWHEIAMSLRGAYLAMHRQADASFAPYGITADQFVVLAVLQGGAVLTQAEVCRRTYSDPNTMGAMLALLQTRGLVRRMKDPQDGRARTVVLTSQGKRLFARIWAQRDAFRSRMAALFTVDETAALLGLLKRIIQELSPSPRRRKTRTIKERTGKAPTMAPDT